MAKAAPIPPVPEFDPAPYHLTDKQMLQLMAIRSSLRMLAELTTTLDRNATVFQDDLSMHLLLLVQPLNEIIGFEYEGRTHDDQ